MVLNVGRLFLSVARHVVEFSGFQALSSDHCHRSFILAQRQCEAEGIN